MDKSSVNIKQPSAALNSISIPDEERSYKDLLKELDALRLLLLGEKRETLNSSSFKESKPDYYENVNFFQTYLSEPQQQKKILKNHFKENLSLAKQVFKLEGFFFEIKKNFMGGLKFDEAADFLVKTVNKKLALIKETVALKKKYPSTAQLEPLSEPLQKLNQNLSLNKEVGLELQESTNALIEPFANDIKSLEYVVATPKKITALKDSYSRVKQKEIFSKEGGKEEIFEQLPDKVLAISQSFSELVDPKKKEEAISVLIELRNRVPKNYENLLEQLKQCEELSKNQNDENIESILNQIKKIDVSIQQILENRGKIDVISKDFVLKKQSSLEELIKKLKDALTPYNIIISSLESRKSDIETLCSQTQTYLSDMREQMTENSILQLELSLWSAHSLIERIEKSLITPFSMGFEELEALNDESVPVFSEMMSKVQKKIILPPMLETSGDLDVPPPLNFSEQEKNDEERLNISNEINEGNNQRLEENPLLENMGKNEDTLGVESEEKSPPLSLVKIPAGRALKHFSLFAFAGAAVFGAVVIRNKYPDSIPGSLPDAVDAIKKMCSIQ